MVRAHSGSECMPIPLQTVLLSFYFGLFLFDLFLCCVSWWFVVLVFLLACNFGMFVPASEIYGPSFGSVLVFDFTPGEHSSSVRLLPPHA
mmetsp:Transcript_93639/g.204977  ORF Transcript_93639/g.204977 Transcript_93639/m.204977 type:complete len:90 (+) Transcript_93639:129-398(+)